jgi:hypothetical protein
MQTAYFIGSSSSPQRERAVTDPTPPRRIEDYPPSQARS